MIKVISFHSTKPGPKLLVTGAVHGDEKCGTYAIRRVLEEIKQGQLNIERGSVTFIPICNPRAFEADTRYIERNLNRYLIPHENPNSYEAELGNILCPFLADCDILLDLHSYSVGGPPFVFVGPYKADDYDYAANLGAAAMLTGWASAYAASGKVEQFPRDPDESTGTTEYSRKFGAMSVTLECGQHKDPASIEVAYQAIQRALRYLGFVEGEAQKVMPAPTKLIEVKKVFYREREGSFTKEWKHLEAVKTHDVIAVYNDGESVHIPGDGYLILPHADTVIGTEWFYWGQEKSSELPLPNLDRQPYPGA